jgi:uncharacterized protein YciI
MLFALICRDKPGALDIRKANREAHLAYAREQGCVTHGGPMLDEAGDMIGSLVTIDVADRAAAEAFAANDPYGKAGLFESVEIVGFKKVFG